MKAFRVVCLCSNAAGIKRSVFTTLVNRGHVRTVTISNGTRERGGRHGWRGALAAAMAADLVILPAEGFTFTGLWIRAAAVAGTPCALWNGTKLSPAPATGVLDRQFLTGGAAVTGREFNTVAEAIAAREQEREERRLMKAEAWAEVLASAKYLKWDVERDRRACREDHRAGRIPGTIGSALWAVDAQREHSTADWARSSETESMLPCMVSAERRMGGTIKPEDAAHLPGCFSLMSEAEAEAPGARKHFTANGITCQW